MSQFPGVPRRTGDEPERARSGMSLVEHAKRELDLLGQTAEDPGYSASIVAAVAAFASYGHSGGSASVAIDHLTRLLNYEALSPITADPAEWTDRSEMSGRPWWQNVRDSRAMSHDGGKTWWYVGSGSGSGENGAEPLPSQDAIS